MNRNEFFNICRRLVNNPQAVESRLTEPRENALRVIENWSETPSLDQRIDLISEIEFIAGFYSALGTLKCLDDPQAGWRLLKRGWLYYYWDHRIVSRGRDFWIVPEGEEKRAFTGAYYLAPLASFGFLIARHEVEWVLRTMKNGITDGSVLWLGSDYFAWYIMQLYNKLLSGNETSEVLPPNAEPWEQPFTELIASWDDEARLQQAIAEACDYHVTWNDDDSEDHEAEFSTYYAIVNPIEIQALRVVRQELGLGMPHVDHEILQSPFYPAPDFVSKITTEEILAEDELLRGIVELNEAWCEKAT